GGLEALALLELAQRLAQIGAVVVAPAEEVDEVTRGGVADGGGDRVGAAKVALELGEARDTGAEDRGGKGLTAHEIDLLAEALGHALVKPPRQRLATSGPV